DWRQHSKSESSRRTQEGLYRGRENSSYAVCDRLRPCKFQTGRHFPLCRDPGGEVPPRRALPPWLLCRETLDWVSGPRPATRCHSEKQATRRGICSKLLFVILRAFRSKGPMHFKIDTGGRRCAQNNNVCC